MRRLLSVLFLIAHTALAADPRLYVMRRGAGGQQGVVRLDAASGATVPFADFIYSAVPAGAFGGLQLTASSDRLIAQGAAFYEVDAASGQLLRRYAALAPPYDSWGFHGAMIGEAEARSLGIAPGYYGSVSCPPGPGAGGEACEPPSVPFPGYDVRSNLSDQRVFLRRGLAPGDTALSVVKSFSADAAGGSPFGERFAALDLAAHQFRFWLQGTTSDSMYLQRSTIAPIGGGTVGDETTARETRIAPGAPADQWRTIRSFAADAAHDGVFLAALYPRLANEQRLLRQSADGSETLLARADGLDSTIDSVAQETGGPPETFTQLLPAVGDTPGANGTYWRSDAWLFNPSDRAMDVELERVSRPGAVQRVTLAAGASQQLANVLRQLGGGPDGDGTALDAVIVRAPFRAGAQLAVTSRTWTPAPNGGTYGQSVPAVPSLAGYSNHLAPTTRSLGMAETIPAFLLDKRDPAQFRHNIGAVNTGDAPLSIQLHYALVSTSGPNDPEREIVFTVPPHSMRQAAVEALFPARVTDALPPYITVTADRPAALFLSMVDNKSGDASFIPFTTFGIESGPDGRLALPGVIHAAGANGTYWRTDAYGVFWNRTTGGNAQEPEVRFFGACTDSSTRTLRPEPGAPGLQEWSQFWYTAFPDLARQLCPGTDAAGALEVRTGSWMTMVSRTYTTRADGGTYGDILPLYPPRGWASRHFAGVELNDAFRVNAGFYNGSDTPSTLSLRLFDASGAVAGERTLSLQPHESMQGALRGLFPGIADGTYGLSVLTIEGTGCWPYLSVVDNVTGDPTNFW